MAAWTRHLRRYVADERGGVLLQVGTMIALLMGLGALSVDAGSLYVTRTRLQIVADAAALAGAAALPNDAAVRKAAQDLAKANGIDGALAPGDITVGNWNGVSFTAGGKPKNAVSVVARRASVNSNALPTFFARFLGTASVDLTQSAVATRSLGTELALVLDTTGSMSRGTRISDLRIAAQHLLDELFNGQETQPDLYVSIVPYIASVNSGSAYTDWIVNLNADVSLLPNAWSDYDPTTWKGCTRERVVHDPVLLEETPPTTHRFDAYFWPSGSYCGRRNDWPDANGEVDETPAAGRDGPNWGCGQSIQPLTKSYSLLSARVTSLKSAIDGYFGTHIDVGLSWGWRTLSPHWRGQWLGDDGTTNTTLPLDYGTPLMSKVMVLMTDGDNVYVGNDYTAYGCSGDVLTAGDLNREMLAVCAAIKARDIVLYVISFGTQVSASTRTKLETCASAADQHAAFPGAKYFHAPSGDDLTDVFENIGRQVNRVRLVR